MTKEEKELLLKDLCARLPYCVKYNYDGNEGCDYTMDRINQVAVDGAFPLEDIKPYLRPMSSMTDEERLELLESVVGKDAVKYFKVLSNGSIENNDATIQELCNFTMHWVNFDVTNTATYIDYLIAHHFDYRGLIEKGLALEAPEDMY